MNKKQQHVKYIFDYMLIKKTKKQNKNGTLLVDADGAIHLNVRNP